MLSEREPTYESDHFTLWKIDNIAYFHFKHIPLTSYLRVSFTDKILRHIDRVCSDDAITVAVLCRTEKSHTRETYYKFFDSIMQTREYREAAMRMFNAFKSLILSIVTSRTIFIGAQAKESTLQMLFLGLACDYFIVSDDTVFTNPALDLGMVPDGGGGFFLPFKLGRRRAMRLMLRSSDLPAQEAFELGLVDKIVPTEELEPASLELARKISQNPPSSLASIKRLCSHYHGELQQYFEQETRELDRCLIRSQLLPKKQT